MDRGEKTADDLNRPEWNDLESNYEKHDVGEAAFVEAMKGEGFVVHDWGIDMRHEDGKLIYDDKMDFKVYDGALGDLVALVDVKTKSRAYYMGELNERHYIKYYGHSEDYDVPIYVVFFEVDGGEIEDCFACRVDAGDVDENIETTMHHGLDSFPDGNSKARFPETFWKSWDQMIQEIEQQ